MTATLPIADLRLILAALAEREWRPIETAPKDGTVVMVYFPVFGRAFACEFDGGRWQTGVWTAQPQIATHWMPIPEGPERGATPSWCVTLPNVAPGPHARAFAFERLLDAANEMLQRAYADHLADDEPDDPTHTTERQFWRQLTVNIAAQMGESDKAPPEEGGE